MRQQARHRRSRGNSCLWVRDSGLPTFKRWTTVWISDPFISSLLAKWPPVYRFWLCRQFPHDSGRKYHRQNWFLSSWFSHRSIDWFKGDLIETTFGMFLPISTMAGKRQTSTKSRSVSNLDFRFFSCWSRKRRIGRCGHWTCSPHRLHVLQDDQCAQTNAGAMEPANCPLVCCHCKPTWPAWPSQSVSSKPVSHVVFSVQVVVYISGLSDRNDTALVHRPQGEGGQKGGRAQERVDLVIYYWPTPLSFPNVE